jgi:hypothetical protein
MSNANWRGIVGVIKPTYKSGSLVDFIHLLPDGVGVVPLFIGAHEHTENEYFRAMESIIVGSANWRRLALISFIRKVGPHLWSAATRLKESWLRPGKINIAYP